MLTLALPAMNKRLSTLALLVVLATVVLTLFAAPSFATEAGGEEGGGKITFPDNEHDQLGLVILGISGLFALAAGANAVKQYRGTRPQADGKIRWR